MISKHVELGGKTENSAETASSRHGAKSVIIIADAVSAFALHVLTLYDESDFAFVEFNSFSFNLVAEASAKNSILGSKRCPLDFLKDVSTLKSLHLKTLTFDPLCALGATHGLAMVFRIGSGLGITNWVTH